MLAGSLATPAAGYGKASTFGGAVRGAAGSVQKTEPPTASLSGGYFRHPRVPHAGPCQTGISATREPSARIHVW
jgi:hypothetical protein